MTLEEWEMFVLSQDPTCLSCGQPLPAGVLEHYDHEDGWSVEGFSARQWLYFVCPACRYQTSFAKFKIEKDLA
jgi:hypothetical protein